jgi:hypothetical protein
MKWKIAKLDDCWFVVLCNNHGKQIATLSNQCNRGILFKNKRYAIKSLYRFLEDINNPYEISEVVY